MPPRTCDVRSPAPPSSPAGNEAHPYGAVRSGPSADRVAGNERHVDRRVSDLAAEQHAMVSTTQLHALGMSRGSIQKRVRAGRLTPFWRGVYRVGPILPPLGPEAAALLACPGAVLGYFSAAAIWGFGERPDSVHVIAAGKRRNRPGLIAHRGSVERRDVRRRQNLALTSPYRTLVDLKGHAGTKAFRHAVWEASYRRLVTNAQAAQLLGERPAPSKHEGERILLRLLRQAGLPEPLTNQRLHGWEFDLYWPDRNVVVELDGEDGHAEDHALGMVRDRRKDQTLRAHGVDVVRVAGAQLAGESLVVVASIAGALGAAA